MPSTVVAIIRVKRRKNDPQAVAPSGWTRVGDLGNGEILCAYIGYDGKYEWNHFQPVEVIGTINVASMEEGKK